MANQPEITPKAKNIANLDPGPGMELELPFTDGPGQRSEESLQEAIEPKQEADDLRHEQPDVRNPISLPSCNDELRQLEPCVGIPVRPQVAEEPIREGDEAKQELDRIQ